MPVLDATVSIFCGKGKKSAWNIWKVYPDLTNGLMALMALPVQVDDQLSGCAGKISSSPYDRTSTSSEVNRACQELFSKKSRSIENIPPTREALRQQHTLLAVYQGC